MKIAILSRSAGLYSTQRLREAALDRGHEVAVVERNDGCVDGVLERHAVEVVDRDVRLGLEFCFSPRRLGCSSIGCGGLGGCVARGCGSRVRFLVQHSVSRLSNRCDMRVPTVFPRAHVAAPVERP